MQYGKTPLFKAASEGHLEVVRLLVEKGAEVNRADRVRRRGGARAMFINVSQSPIHCYDYIHGCIEVVCCFKILQVVVLMQLENLMRSNRRHAYFNIPP